MITYVWANEYGIHGGYLAPEEGKTYWYRYVDSIDRGSAFENHDIRLACFPVLKETECSVLLAVGYEKTRRCFKDARKSFAYPTRKIALNSYLIRKKWQVRRLEQQLDDARVMLAGAALATGLMK